MSTWRGLPRLSCNGAVETDAASPEGPPSSSSLQTTCVQPKPRPPAPPLGRLREFARWPRRLSRRMGARVVRRLRFWFRGLRRRRQPRNLAHQRRSVLERFRLLRQRTHLGVGSLPVRRNRPRPAPVPFSASGSPMWCLRTVSLLQLSILAHRRAPFQLPALGWGASTLSFDFLVHWSGGNDRTVGPLRRRKVVLLRWQAGRTKATAVAGIQVRGRLTSRSQRLARAATSTLVASVAVHCSPPACLCSAMAIAAVDVV